MAVPDTKRVKLIDMKLWQLSSASFFSRRHPLQFLPFP
jgi:hypothetical protein